MEAEKKIICIVVILVIKEVQNVKYFFKL
jgi:hypothetical protein